MNAAVALFPLLVGMPSTMSLCSLTNHFLGWLCELIGCRKRRVVRQPDLYGREILHIFLENLVFTRLAKTPPNARKAIDPVRTFPRCLISNLAS
jgi:hypothetical protein